MVRLTVALGLNVGLCFFFGVNAISLLRGTSLSTAMLRGLSALVLFALLGVVVGLVLSSGDSPAESPAEVRGDAENEGAAPQRSQQNQAGRG